MKNQKRIRDYGIVIGNMRPGARNAITDIEGVRVGHCTIEAGGVQSGVTAVIPAEGNLFEQKVMAASRVINGFGKSTGLIQIDEIGTIETPILLTNTVNVGNATQAMVDISMKENKDIADTASTINPVVCECNDAYLNDARTCVIEPAQVKNAITSAGTDFAEGAVGAGRGMSCYQLKGGIGSSSRQVELEHDIHHLGCLVLTNMGQAGDLVIGNRHIGAALAHKIAAEVKPDDGSIIVIIGCDLPLSERQLKRICNRAIVGISRTGSHLGNGSGEIVLAFSTANRICHEPEKGEKSITFSILIETHMDIIFRATIECVEEAIMNSLITAEKVTGFKGRSRPILKDFTDLLS